VRSEAVGHMAALEPPQQGGDSTAVGYVVGPVPSLAGKRGLKPWNM
jgi:hypothetical protein